MNAQQKDRLSRCPLCQADLNEGLIPKSDLWMYADGVTHYSRAVAVRAERVAVQVP